MRSALPNLHEAESFEDPSDLPRPEGREARHALSDGNRLDPDELSFEAGFTVLEEHRNDLLEVGLKLVEGLGLAMGAGETWHVADQEAGIRIALDNRCVVPH